MNRLSTAPGLVIAASLFLSVGCGDEMESQAEEVAFDTTATTQIEAGDMVAYTVTGLDNGQAYRVTLVVEDNVTVDDGSGTFIDNDSNGAADAGASENIALITSVNGEEVTGAKTVPAGTDDPSNPSGIFPEDGTITLMVTGVAGGTIYPVLYENGGDSTFLEIDGNGTPIETHRVGGAVEVAVIPVAVAPEAASTISPNDTVDYTVTGLTDSQAYRVTLVVGANVTSENGVGTFVDNDDNGAADAGASQEVALITTIGGITVADGGAKTVPAGSDDPANPTGMYPSNGTLTFTVTGVAAGSVNPVIYHNGGTSTFLEIDEAGIPVENYVIGAATIVQ